MENGGCLGRCDGCCFSPDDMNILSYDSKLKQMRFVYTEKYNVNQQIFRKILDKQLYQAYN